MIIGFFLPATIASQLALPNGESPDALRLTLAFLGDTAGDDLVALTKQFADSNQPVTGRINGIARFAGNDSQDAVVALVDSPELAEFRQNLIEFLTGNGVEPVLNHSFIPHITLAYIEPDSPLPIETIEPVEVIFDTLSLLEIEGEKHSFPLGEVKRGIMDPLQKLFEKIKAIFDDAKTDRTSEDAPTERAVSIDVVYGRVWDLCEMRHPMAYLKDVFTDQSGAFFAIISQDGRLYRSAITVGEGDTVQLGELELVTQEFVPAGMVRTTITRQADGKVRWLSISATSTINKDGEIDSRTLFDNFARRAEETGEYPERIFYHQRGQKYVVGQADFLARSGNCYITGGVYNDSLLAQAEIEARSANPEQWGDSIGYIPMGPVEFIKVRGFDIPVYKDGINVEISTLPAGDASSLFIRTEVQRSMNERQIEALAKLAFDGDVGRAKQWVEENPEEINRQIENRGLVTRATGEAPEFELTDEAIQIIVTRAMEADVIRAQQVKLDEQAQAIVTLQEKLTSVETVLAQVERRLGEVEATDQDKRRQMANDLPANAIIPKLTYRPSVERGKEQPVQPNGKDVAEKTLDGIGLTY